MSYCAEKKKPARRKLTTNILEILSDVTSPPTLIDSIDDVSLDEIQVELHHQLIKSTLERHLDVQNTLASWIPADCSEEFQKFVKQSDAAYAVEDEELRDLLRNWLRIRARVLDNLVDEARKCLEKTRALREQLEKRAAIARNHR